jgi:hypothetical protein
VRADLGEQTWRRVRAAIDGYAGDMLHFIAKCYGVDAIQQGWFEFTAGKSEEFLQGDPNAELFFSWLFPIPPVRFDSPRHGRQALLHLRDSIR